MAKSKFKVEKTAEMRPIPRQPVLGAIADIAKSAKNIANKVYLKEEIPLLGGEGLGELLLGQTPEELERISTGDYPLRMQKYGLGQIIPTVKPGRAGPLMDLAFTAAPMAKPAARGLRAIPEGLKMAGEDLLRAGVTASPLDVYHGTPHRFPATEANPLGEFDASKIGTGEGSQAYGHGTYLAEAPGAADQYRKNLQGGPLGTDIMKAVHDALGVKYHEGAGAAEFLDSVRKLSGEGENVIKDAIIKASDRMAKSQFPGNQRVAPLVRELADNPKVLKAINETKGFLYKAALPDEMIDRMLDWDKPLSEQPESVRKGIEKLLNSGLIAKDTAAMLKKKNSVGSALYRFISSEVVPQGRGMDNYPGAEAASKILNDYGIPGIKYFDAGSRGPGGSGTRNFVVFPGEEKKVKILERKAKGGAVDLAKKYGLAEGGPVDAYQAWLKKYGVKESSDYNTRAAFNAGLVPDERGHMTDEYKLPNHITFSEESVYAKKKGAPPAGRWVGSDQAGWTFYASPTNVKNAGGADKLVDYFKRAEPGVKLVLPQVAKPPFAEGGLVNNIELPETYFSEGGVVDKTDSSNISSSRLFDAYKKWMAQGNSALSGINSAEQLYELYRNWQRKNTTAPTKAAQFASISPTTVGKFGTVYDPKTGREFVSPAQAMAAGVKNYVSQLPSDFALPSSLQGYDSKKIGELSAKYGMTPSEFVNYQRQGEIRGAAGQQMRDKMAEYGATLSPEYLTARLQAYKDNPPTTESGMRDYQALWEDYSQRYANSSYDYKNMGGKPKDYSLEPSSSLVTPSGEFRVNYTGYADPINQLLNKTQGTPDFTSLQNILAKNPVVSDAIQNVMNVTGKFFDPNISSAYIRNLSSDIDKKGEETALRDFYSNMASIYGDARTAVSGYDPTYDALTKLAFTTAPKAEDAAWYAAAKSNSPQALTQASYRDPKSGFGISVDVDPNTGLPSYLTAYDPSGKALSPVNFRAEELYKLADQYGINLSGIGTLGEQLQQKNISYSPYSLYAGTGSDAGINFADIAKGGLGSAYDWTVDPNVALKGPSAASQLAENQALAARLGLTATPQVTTNAGLDPSRFAMLSGGGNDPSRRYVVYGGGDTASWYGTLAEANAAAQRYSGSQVIDLTKQSLPSNQPVFSGPVTPTTPGGLASLTTATPAPTLSSLAKDYYSEPTKMEPGPITSPGIFDPLPDRPSDMSGSTEYGIGYDDFINNIIMDPVVTKPKMSLPQPQSVIEQQPAPYYYDPYSSYYAKGGLAKKYGVKKPPMKGYEARSLNEKVIAHCLSK